MKDKIIVIQENEGRAGTFLVARGFQRQHKHILELVSKYQSEFEKFGRLKRRKIQTKGRPIEEILLTEDQFIFLGTILRNSSIVIRFKQKLVEEFSRVRRQLLAVKAQQSDQKWIMSRDFGKEQRFEATEAIKEFVEYAKSQGSENADRYYTIISRMMNGLLFISAGKFKNLRDVLTAQQLMIIANAEQIISKGLRDCMKSKMFYKDIYKQIKENVLKFAGLTGQTHVIEKQLKLKEEHSLF